VFVFSCIFMHVPYYYMKKPKHVTRFGQQILLSENIVVFDSLFVCSFGYKKTSYRGVALAI
jgi:hypothetical protein